MGGNFNDLFGRDNCLCLILIVLLICCLCR